MPAPIVEFRHQKVTLSPNQGLLRWRWLLALSTLVSIAGLETERASAQPYATTTITKATLELPDRSHLVASPASMVKLAQATTFPDVQGNWAQIFIQALAARGIVSGDTEGTFRPNYPVTRAEFAAMIGKAFPIAAIRSPLEFVDVSPSYWAYGAIEQAYQTGFLQGDPNRIFRPNDNVTRAEALVALATGLNLSPSTVTNLNTYYQDASQIPDFARDKIAADTDNRIVVNYPLVNSLNPNQPATRADVVAFIYQALVKTGAVAPLPASEVATQYIVGYQPPVAQQPQVPVETLRQQLQLSPPSTVQVPVRSSVGVPAVSLNTPSAFGADGGKFFLGGGYQNRTLISNKDDGGVAVGLGLGNAKTTAGLEVSYASYSTFRSGFLKTGAISFKLHRLLTDDLALAFGTENVIRVGSNRTDAIPTGYGVVSKIFRLQADPSKALSAVTLSLGLGGGRFRSESDILNGKDNVNVFGSLAVRVLEPVSLISEWNGEGLNLGASIAPFRNIPIVITPALTDITGNTHGLFGNSGGSRFTLGVGFGFSLF